MPLTCSECGGTQIEVDPIRGDSICISCGTVLAENNIVSEVQFVDNAAGGSSAVGTFIKNDGTSSIPGGRQTFNGSNVFQAKSRDLTINNALRKIREIINMLHLPSPLIEVSLSFYKLGLNKNLTKGRTFEIVIGACVYISCRTELAGRHEMPMLFDISDALRIDIYKLGRTYLKFTKEFCIAVPLMDPCLYIMRFSQSLMNEKVDKVTRTAIANTATRLVKRMERDWMAVGRRPSGICGAALVIAARLHNCNVTLHDAIKVVKVHESTLRKRLSEFGKTKSSFLTVDEFMTKDLPDEEDPPAFRAARIKEEEIRIQKMIDKDASISSELKEIHKEIQKELEHKRSKLSKKYAKEDKQTDKKSVKRPFGSDDSFILSSENSQEIECTQSFITESTLKSINECIEDSHNKSYDDLSPEIGIRPSAASLGLKHSIEDCMKVIPPPEMADEESDVLDLTGIDENEIDTYIMSEREINTKTKMWMELNKEYLEEQRIKEENEKKDAEQREKDGLAPKKKRTYTRRQKKTGPANTAGEAIENLIQQKNLSSKVNYDILKNLNGELPENGMSRTEETFNANNNKVPKKAPVERPEEITSILQSLAGKKPKIIVKTEPSPKKEKIDEHEDEELEDEEEEEDEEGDDDEEEEEDDEDKDVSVFALMQKQRLKTNSYYM